LTIIAYYSAIIFVNGQNKGVTGDLWNLSLPVTSIGAWSWPQKQAEHEIGILRMEYFQTFSLSESLWLHYNGCDHLNADLSCAVLISSTDR
jgi:hypothetical protein